MLFSMENLKLLCLQVTFWTADCDPVAVDRVPKCPKAFYSGKSRRLFLFVYHLLYRTSHNVQICTVQERNKLERNAWSMYFSLRESLVFFSIWTTLSFVTPPPPPNSQKSYSWKPFYLIFDFTHDYCTHVYCSTEGWPLAFLSSVCVRIFKQSMEARNRPSTGPPDYIGWRNWFLGIDSWAPSKFENLGSGLTARSYCDCYGQPLPYIQSKLWVKRQIAESRAWIENENR